ncbi:MAG: molybdenum cofactor guanylyltransferase [Solirubrobacterales bacterium]|nr:molybdenum cofactor guanylyltransferase [Solirubrobacterales bacterium]
MLAGGDGRRIGGDKAMVELEGRPLIAYVLEALHEVVDDVAVVAKRDTLLPSLVGHAQVWIEPDEPQHPLCGVVHALKLARGRPVLVVAVDLPLVDAATLGELLAVDLEGAPGVVPVAHGRLQPLCARYAPSALRGLETFDHAARTTDVVRGLGVKLLEASDPDAFLNVNRPEDLLQAGALLGR